jgi:ceramide glucosyltransferase
MVIQALLGFLALLSLALILWQWWAGRHFPLHQRAPGKPPFPGITIFKPLKNCDAETKRCLRSWLTQDYPGPVQLLFGVASPTDPVIGVVRALQAEFPERNTQLVFCPESLGANAKVSTLIQLESHAIHPLCVISDADVWAPEDLLVNLLQPLQNPAVGLMSCFYALANPTTPAMHWEAVAINADFWSQVLQGQCLWPLDYALGAVMATTRRQLDAIGGLAALRDYLADDNRLGHLIAKKGAQMTLCPVVVECHSSPAGWVATLRHQLRWARTIRACQPLPYAFSLMGNATFWPLLWISISPSTVIIACAMFILAVRLSAARDLQKRLTRQNPWWRWGWMVWFKDLAQAALLIMAFTGNEVQWHQERYRIRHGGKLVRIQPDA